MRLIFTFLLFFLFDVAISQTFKEKELKTEIGEVTVFLSGAQIFETGNTTIPTGKSIIRVTNLSPFLDDKSVQVKADGDFTILSVNHKFNYLNELKKDKKIDSLKEIVNKAELAIARENARLEVLREKQSLLNANKDLGSQTSGATLVQLKQAIDFYEAEVTKIKDEEIKVNKSIEIKTTELSKLVQQLKELNEQNSLPSSEIEIRVSSESQTSAKFSLTYLVANAGWYPKYDIRVEDVKSPLELTYKAEVYQNTGVDWKNVKLRFSNGDPNQSGVVPELLPWHLNYARNTIFDKSAYGLDVPGSIRNVKGKVMDEEGEAMPGVNVVVKGTTIGTVTDVEGNYNLTLPNGASELIFSFIGMTTQVLPINKPEINIRLQNDVQQLSEIIVTGQGVQRERKALGYSTSTSRQSSSLQIVTAVVENQTTVEIEVAAPYSIKSNGEKLQVDLRKHEIEALYEYYAIPKLDKDAFLIARIINWDQYNLLEGEANLYYEDAYVGRSILDAKALQDTLNISLGRDKNIVVGREKNEQFSRKRTIGSNVVETRGFKIIVRNKKTQSIKLTLFDQIPVSVISDISVNPVELTNGQLDTKTGKVTWEFNLDPSLQKEINLQYEVKYPKREKIVLE